MSDSENPMNALGNRRDFLRKMGLGAAGLAASTALGSTLLSGVASAQTPSNLDAFVLNFALNLEYLEAEYYTYAVSGVGIESFGIGVNGVGTPGMVTIKANPKVTFTTPAIQQYATEIAADERAHVRFIRQALANAGAAPVARPAIDLQNSFNALAQAAGIGPSFDPFANELNFVLGAFIFEDVGVTAYKGAARLLSNKDILEAAAGILAVEAYHAGSIRSVIYNAGATARELSQKISDLRDVLDRPADTDQGVVMDGMANIVLADDNALAYSRTPREVLNIVYASVDGDSGGFFPNGVNEAPRLFQRTPRGRATLVRP